MIIKIIDESSEDVTAIDQYQNIFNAINERKDTIYVSFANVKSCSVSFIDTIIGNLYRNIDNKILEKRLRIVSEASGDAIRIKRIIKGIQNPTNVVIDIDNIKYH